MMQVVITCSQIAECHVLSQTPKFKRMNEHVGWPEVIQLSVSNL